MPLQELDQGINQVGEEYSKHEDQDDATSTVNGYAHRCKEQYGQEDVRRAAFWKSHFQSSIARNSRNPVRSQPKPMKGKGPNHSVLLGPELKTGTKELS